MAGAMDGHCRLYRGYAASRLWRGLGAAAALGLTLAAGGCSLSYQLDSFLGSDKSDITGSIKRPPGSARADKLPPKDDLAYARAAANEVLRRGRKDASQPWENPQSGARGTVTPIASTYLDDGQTCRNFLASYVNGRASSWLQGEACKEQDTDSWQVRSFKPWKSS
jgi:surface antigen